MGRKSSSSCAVFDRHYAGRFLIHDHPPTAIDDDLAEGGHDSRGEDEPRNALDGDEPPTKKPRLSGAQKKKLARASGVKQTGANKGRRFAKVRDEIDVCWKFASGETCPNGPRYSFSLTTRYPSKS